MPSPMTKDATATPSVKVLDDYLQSPVITRIEADSDYEGCAAAARVCYQITHSGPVVIPAGS